MPKKKGCKCCYCGVGVYKEGKVLCDCNGVEKWTCWYCSQEWHAMKVAVDCGSGEGDPKVGKCPTCKKCAWDTKAGPLPPAVIEAMARSYVQWKEKEAARESAPPTGGSSGDPYSPICRAGVPVRGERMSWPFNL